MSPDTVLPNMPNMRDYTSADQHGMKILLAEDDPLSRHRLVAILKKWGYEVAVAKDGTQAWQQMQTSEAPQLVILDWMMPGMDGLEVCQKIRQRGQEPYVYMILLTARSSQKDLLVGLGAGADDYLAKPFDLQELQVRLRAGRRILDLQAELIATREALRDQATHDFLTGIWNRRAILDFLSREWPRARRESHALGIVMVDLDHFKKINDVHGHPAGDAVLCEAADRMRALIRPYDGIGRYGGEEFLIVLVGCGPIETVKVAERLRAGLETCPFTIPEGKLSVTGSFGVFVEDPHDSTPESLTGKDDIEDMHALLKIADNALYQAKHQGRNQVIVGKLSLAQAA